MMLCALSTVRNDQKHPSSQECGLIEIAAFETGAHLELPTLPELVRCAVYTAVRET